MSKGTEIFKKYLDELLNDENKLQAFIDNMEKEAQEEKEKALLFGQTITYEIALTNLNKYLDTNSDHVCLDEYRDFVTPDMNNETFLALHDYAFYSESIVEIVDIFPVDYVVHKGIFFKKTYGQGTLYSACKYPNDTYVLREDID